MKKLVLVLLIILISFVPLNNHYLLIRADSDSEHSIFRSIVTKIKWNQKLRHIDVYKIMLQKVNDTPIQVFKTIEVIDSTDFNSETVLSDRGAYQYVHESRMLDSEDDSIFGKRVPIFKDLSGVQNLNDAEIKRWVELAKKQIELDFKNPPVNKDEGFSAWVLIYYLIIYGLPIMILFSIILLTNRFMRKNRNQEHIHTKMKKNE